jgi:hypothetical protein
VGEIPLWDPISNPKGIMDQPLAYLTGSLSIGSLLFHLITFFFFVLLRQGLAI